MIHVLKRAEIKFFVEEATSLRNRKIALKKQTNKKKNL